MYLKKYFTKLSVLGLLFLPTNVYAVEKPTTFKALIQIFLDILGLLIPISVAAALVVFVFGIAEIVFNAGNQSKISDGRQKMFYGVIGLFVLMTLWGILTFMGATIGIESYIRF